uniref:Uncharacterized protein n=1 Tax=Knipowitschia caucasica TaxID=637954 RepID=A0AAV2LG95_KNICA
MSRTGPSSPALMHRRSPCSSGQASMTPRLNSTNNCRRQAASAWGSSTGPIQTNTSPCLSREREQLEPSALRTSYDPPTKNNNSNTCYGQGNA